MSKNSTIKSLISNVKFGLKKHSPEILIGVGIVGVVASTVLSCRATIKANDVLHDAKEELDNIKNNTKDEETAKKERRSVYVKTSGKLAKLYSKPVAIGVASITAIIASNGVSRKRYGAMAAAYATVDSGFKAYRKNVVDRFGEEVDRQLKLGLTPTDIKEKVTDENGKEKTVKKSIEVTNKDPNELKEYVRFFDESNPYWQKDAELNKMFLRAQMSFFNDKLKVEKRVFLNDVLKALGFPTTKAGQIVGWVYDPENPDIDNYIDFGINDIYRPAVRDFINGYERSIMLDFNVDGNIWKDM